MGPWAVDNFQLTHPNLFEVEDAPKGCHASRKAGDDRE